MKSRGMGEEDKTGKEQELRTDRGRVVKTQRLDSCVLTGAFTDTTDETETCAAPVLCNVCGLFWPDVRVSDLMSGLVPEPLQGKTNVETRKSSSPE